MNRAGIRYALMGGFALGLRGAPRATSDLDFLVDRDDLPKLDAIMAGLGYELHYRSDHVSQFLNPVRALGAVDFLHSFREASREALARAERHSWGDGTPDLPVLRTEDLIGFKLQAARNDPQRESREIEDIDRLLAAAPSGLDWKLVEAYFTLFERPADFAALRGKYGR